MPRYIQARPAESEAEERHVRKLAGSRHGPADVIRRAQTVVGSWAGKTTHEIAHELECHPQTVRERLTCFNAMGLEGLEDAPGRGRKARLTERERSAILGLLRQAPPGRLVRETDGELDVRDETGDALAHAAEQRGIRIKRSQIRRIFLKEGIPWRRPRSWASSTDPEFVPKERRSSRSTPNLR